MHEIPSFCRFQYLYRNVNFLGGRLVKEKSLSKHKQLEKDVQSENLKNKAATKNVILWKIIFIGGTISKLLIIEIQGICWKCYTFHSKFVFVSITLFAISSQLAFICLLVSFAWCIFCVVLWFSRERLVRPNTSDFSTLVSAVSVCLRIPRVLLGQLGSFKSVHILNACVYRLGLVFTSHPKDNSGVWTWDLNLPGRAHYQLSYIPAPFKVMVTLNNCLVPSLPRAVFTSMITLSYLVLPGLT